MAHRGVGIVSKTKMDSVKSPINHKRLKGAVKAVIENLKISEGESQILEPIHEISLVVTLHKRIPHNLASLFKLPHPIFNDSTEICVFTKDISVKDPDKTVEYYERRFRTVNSPIKFIPFESLKRDYKTPEAKRHLARSFGLFVIEARIQKFISKYLGKDFYCTPAARRIRVLDFESESLKALFHMTVNTTLWTRKGIERCTKIYVAPSNFSIADIVDNLDACIKAVAFSVMRGWDNVRYLHVAGRKTLHYPIYANENVTKEVEELDFREAVRQFMKTKDKMKGDDLYVISDQELHGMLLKRLDTLKKTEKTKPPKKKKLKLDPVVEENDEEDIDSASADEESGSEEELTDDESKEENGEDVAFEE